MLHARRIPGRWLAGAWALTLGGMAVLAWLEFGRLREAFDTDARIVHRLLSQRAVEHDAILATLTLLQPASQRPGAEPEQRLPALYAQILAVQRRNPGDRWPEPDAAALAAAEVTSRSNRRAALAPADIASGRYRLVLGADPTSFALSIDMRTMVPWADWPMKPETSPVRVTLAHGGQAFVVQAGQDSDDGGRLGWPLTFHKTLAADSQPFAVVAQRRLGPADLPWTHLLAWTLAVWSSVAVAYHLQRQRSERRRAEDLLRLGQVARLNTLGEMAAGLAHELNQPLTAVLASTQAARRLLQDNPPDIDTARSAMQQAVEQARRAANVVGRLRRSIERPQGAPAVQTTDLAQAARRVLDLLEPDLQRCGVRPTVEAAVPVPALADPVALEQILHNLLTNALQALEQVPMGQRRLRLDMAARDGQAELRVSDSGPGLPGDLPTRIFEPFYSTRAGGLGLGLSLSESLASGMGGSLSASHLAPQGAEFCLRLPLAGGRP